MTPRPARYWHRDTDDRLACTLCPRLCRLHEGQTGFCAIRAAQDGELVQLSYGRTTGFAVDPIEKKPLNHFLPGTSVLSFGTAGCNLGCRFCQNWSISAATLDEAVRVEASPEAIVALARREGCPSVAMTYNDPVTWAEYAIDISKAARANGLRSVLVTAGYVTAEARPDLYAHIDAVNVDLKAFTEAFYRKVTLAHIEPVKETLIWLAQQRKVWLEVTTLLIPGLNDGDAELRALCTWVGSELGVEVPLHFTAFHPDFKLRDRPATPPATLTRARRIGREVGLRYVYTGNVHDTEGGATLCPGCGTVVIARDWHVVTPRAIGDGRCTSCGTAIAGVFDGPVEPSRGGRWRVAP